MLQWSTRHCRCISVTDELPEVREGNAYGQPYKVTFKPNLNRKHTRGKRGASEVTLNQEFLDYRGSRDRQLNDKSRDIAKLSRSQARAYRERGARAKPYRVGSKADESVSKVVDAARSGMRRRIQTGTNFSVRHVRPEFAGSLVNEAKNKFKFATLADRVRLRLKKKLVASSSLDVNKVVAFWRRNHDIPPSLKSMSRPAVLEADWGGVDRKVKRAIFARLGQCHIDLKLVIDKWKQNREVDPTIDVDELKSADWSLYSNKLKRQIISALLLRSGNVEQNPGPTLCPNDNQRIVGLRKFIHKDKPFYVCPLCDVKLIHTDNPSIHLHPSQVDLVMNDDVSASPCNPVSTTTAALPISSPTVVTSETAVQLKRPVSISRSTPLLFSHCQPATIMKLMAICLGMAVIYYGYWWILLIVYGVVWYKSRPKIPVAKVTGALGGVIVDWRVERDVMRQLTNRPRLMHFSIDRRQLDIPYLGERRIVSHRNIAEVKSPLTLVNLSAKRFEPRPIWPAFLVFVTFASYLGAFLCIQWQVLEGRTSCYNTSHDAVMCATLYPFVDMRLFHIITAVVVLCQMVYTICSLCIPTYTIQNLCYCPHLVSCVLSDFDRFVDKSVAWATCRSKMRRVCSLPLPDVDQALIWEGTELIVLHLLESRAFMRRGPVSMGLGS